MNMGFTGPGLMFSIVPIMVTVGFIIVFGTIIFRLVNYGTQKTKPEETKAARVISKRQHVWGQRRHTSYYATFELESGERVEYQVPSNKVGFIAEGDYGRLTSQGTLFVAFDRDIENQNYYD